MKFYGYYSAKAAELYFDIDEGHPRPERLPGKPIYSPELYRTPTGRAVLVTAVDTDEKGENYKWEDKVCLGEVRGLVRPVNRKEVLEWLRVATDP